MCLKLENIARLYGMIWGLFETRLWLVTGLRAVAVQRQADVVGVAASVVPSAPVLWLRSLGRPPVSQAATLKVLAVVVVAIDSFTVIQ